MNKPTKPNITIPESFAANGVKADFDNNKILNGFDRIQPDVLAGDNLNKFIDDTYKGLNYGIKGVDYLEERWKSQLTNCILEIPQRIKLELNNGVLTLKSGSEVIVPNGFEEDGVTTKFEYMSTPRDLSAMFEQAADDDYMVFVRTTLDIFDYRPIRRQSSGNTASDPQATSWHYYNTQTNKVDCYLASGDKVQNSLPICVITVVDKKAHSIKQVFNGMGYIGSTIWVDKGIECLIPNGRNEDGTLNNIEHTTSKVGILNAGTSNTKFYVVIDTSKGEGVFLPNYSSIGKTRYYDFETNYWYINATNGTGGEKAQWCMLSGYIHTGDNNIITSASFNKPFRAMDSNEVPHIIGTYVNGTSGYRTWSDKYHEEWGFSQGSGTLTIRLLKPYANTNYQIQMTNTFNVVMTDARVIDASQNTVSSFKIVNGSNAQVGCYWMTCGYIA